VCQHLGFHSLESRYDRDTEILCFVVVCDDCGMTIRELFSQPYRPAPHLEV
jgi:hypothetical protein